SRPGESEEFDRYNPPAENRVPGVTYPGDAPASGAIDWAAIDRYVAEVEAQRRAEEEATASRLRQNSIRRAQAEAAARLTAARERAEAAARGSGLRQAGAYVSSLENRNRQARMDARQKRLRAAGSPDAAYRQVEQQRERERQLDVKLRDLDYYNTFWQNAEARGGGGLR